MNKVIDKKTPCVDWHSLAEKLAHRIDAELSTSGDLPTDRVTALSGLANAVATAQAAAFAAVNIEIDTNDDPRLEARCVFVRTERTLIALSRDTEWRSFTFQAPIIEVIPKCGGILAYSRMEAVFFRCLEGVFVPTPAFAARPLPDQLQTDGQPVTEGDVTCWAA